MLLKSLPYKDAYECLDYYCKLVFPKYALLVEGEWGSGKTWFINEFITTYDNDNKIKFIYISLFGLTKVEEIIYAIFEYILQLKTNRKVKSPLKFAFPILGKLFSKMGFDIGKQDFNTLIYELVDKYCENKDNIVLVFDDYERSKIDHDELMGFISKSLNEQGIKIIVICNTNSYNLELDVNKDFLERREKIIGMITHIKSDINSFWDTLLTKTNDKKIHDIFVKNKNNIIKTFTISKNTNLRNLIKLNENYKFLYEKLPPNIQSNNKFQTDLIQTYLIMIIESYANPHFYKSILMDNLKTWPSRIYLKKDEKNNDNLIKFIDKYTEINFVITPQFWKEFLCEGKINIESIEEYFINASYDISKTPIPMLLLSFYKMDFSEVSDLIEKMINNLKLGEYKKTGILLHAFGIMLYLSKNNIINYDIKFITNLCNYILEHNAFEDDDGFFTSQFNDSWGGFVFFDCNSDEFEDIYKKIKNKYMEYVNKLNNNKANTLLKLINEDIGRATEFITMNDKDTISFPLEYVDIKKFSDSIVTINNNSEAYQFIINLTIFLEKRIAYQYDTRETTMAWIKQFKDTLFDSLNAIENIEPILKYNINKLRNVIAIRLSKNSV